MADKRKKKKKRWIIPAVVAAVLATLFIVFVASPMARMQSALQSAAVSVNTRTAEKGTIEKTVVGSGTLSASDTLDVKIPASVTVERVHAEAGDTVKAGDTLATLDPDSVQNAILGAQDEISAIDEQINTAQEDEEDESVIKSSVSGRVKEIFAQEGDNARDVAERSGALLTLSIDGRMKVSFPTSASPSVGDDVTVTLSDGGEEDGVVVAVWDGGCTVTLTDNGPAPGDRVTVEDGEGGSLGSGELEINTPVRVMGGTGYIGDVNVELNERVSASDTLFTITEGTAERSYESLMEQRAEQESLLRDLFALARTNTVDAPRDGTLSEIFVTGTEDGETAQNSGADASANGQMPVAVPGEGGLSVSDLAYASGGGAGMYADVPDGRGSLAEDGMALLGETPVTPIDGTVNVFINNPIKGNTPQSTVMPGQGYTGTLTWDPPVTKFEQSTVYTATVTLTAGAGYTFTDTAVPAVTGAQVSGAAANPSGAEGNTLTFTAAFPATEAEAAADPAQQGGAAQYPSGNTGMSGLDLSALTGGSSSSAGGLYGGGSYSGGSYSGGSYGGDDLSASDSAEIVPETESGLYIPAFSMQTGGAGKLVIGVDELDILFVRTGQTAEVTLDALPDEVFSAEVVRISDSGDGQSGVTTYPVTLTLSGARQADLKAGMNANVTIVVDTRADVLVVPLDALQEMDGKRYVQVTAGGEDAAAAAEEQTAVPGELREVQTGLSDGVNVEITSGLSEGETILWESVSSDDGGFMFGGMGGMGGMGGGSMRVVAGSEGDRGPMGG